MSPTVRRVLARMVLAGGVATGVALFVRDCSETHHDLTVVIDPRPTGDAIESLRVDLAAGDRALGWAERSYQPGEARRPLTLHAGAPGGPAQLTIELITTRGPRRIRRTLEAPAGSTITVTIEDVEPTSP